MNTATQAFRDIVTDQVTTRVAIEARAGFPQGLTDRTFEAITAELIMADWDALAALPVEQAVARICGVETKTRRPHKESRK